MISRNVIDMPKLYRLREKGYGIEMIASILSVSEDTVRTILGAHVGAHYR